MRKTLVFILCLLLLGACAPKEYTVTVNEDSFFVDTARGEITSGGETYKYEVRGGTTTVTYPDGSTYWQETREGFGGTAGWSDDYDEDKYVGGRTLLLALRAGTAGRKEPEEYILVIAALLIGIWNLAAPRSSWYVSYGWRYKNAEPSDAALFAARAAGVVCVVVAAVLII